MKSLGERGQSMSSATISRRSLLRGLGASAALLGPMARAARAYGAGISTTKLVILTQANGSDPSGWTPTGGETDFVLSKALASVGDRDVTFPLPHGRGDEFHHGSPGLDPRSLPPGAPKPRDIVIPDLHIDTIKMKTRDFR